MTRVPRQAPKGAAVSQAVAAGRLSALMDLLGVPGVWLAAKIGVRPELISNARNAERTTPIKASSRRAIELVLGGPEAGIPEGYLDGVGEVDRAAVQRRWPVDARPWRRDLMGRETGALPHAPDQGTPGAAETVWEGLESVRAQLAALERQVAGLRDGLRGPLAPPTRGAAAAIPEGRPGELARLARQAEATAARAAHRRKSG